ncbi:sulfurtransferase TusA family protein [Paracoccus benzoatiresistens]|uniref:Sulfurtransferase TusA family protein n=1 Tax=Paracoccus benzoatiresistens TaxID=2997341 RepID=A0ABT4IYU8_9RHOB|nr:sulfurtransferase TusA family protein [Paracoccus sp. EF6]MCZ0960037.1 sulfurtransferase TusA family protein [Paracoccus sp. EF6]
MNLVIDARGLLCPLPVLRLRKVLVNQPEGAQVRLLATDAMAAVDVPHFCETAGHLLVGQRDRGDGVTEFTVERGPSAPSAAGAASPPGIFE